MKKHQYHTQLNWTGNTGEGTSSYARYKRDHTISINNKSDLLCSSDPSFRGDPSRHNPEELLVASLSSCHMLWYLHLCAVNGIIVLEYSDNADGTMAENPDGSGFFEEVVLKPKVLVKNDDMIAKANELHHEAHQKCFIANSVNFPVKHDPIILAKN
jgi:organic hydroperoxide reductase OsmC/OhrA